MMLKNALEIALCYTDECIGIEKEDREYIDKALEGIKE